LNGTREVGADSPIVYLPRMSEETALKGYCAAAAGRPFHGPHHDREYGFLLRPGTGEIQ
jgi:hypothetical protein